MISAPFHMCVLLLSAHSSKVLILSFTRVRNSGCAVEAPVKQSGLVDQVTRVLKRERMRWEEFWLQLNTQRSSYCRTCSYRRLGTSDEEHRVSGGFASLGTIPPYYCSTSFPDWTPCTCCHSLRRQVEWKLVCDPACTAYVNATIQMQPRGVSSALVALTDQWWPQQWAKTSHFKT
jgi:hypothetical protein